MDMPQKGQDGYYDLNEVLEALAWETLQLSAFERIGAYLHKAAARGGSERLKRASYRTLGHTRRINDNIAELLTLIEETQPVTSETKGQSRSDALDLVGSQRGDT